jgi:hypothetical protein
MKRLRLKRKSSRNEIRYRLHTSIQAAAYVADDPSHENIDRELRQIVTADRAGRPLRPDRVAARVSSRVACLVVLCITSFLAGIVMHVEAMAAVAAALAVMAALWEATDVMFDA